MFERGHSYVGWQGFCERNVVGQDVWFWDLCAVWTVCSRLVPASAGENVVGKVGDYLRNGSPEGWAW